jgi:predicted CXXCH cytochrome family protein
MIGAMYEKVDRKERMCRMARLFRFTTGLILLLAVWFLIFPGHALAFEKSTDYEKILGNLKDAKFVGSDDCASCHAKEAREFSLSTHSRIQIRKGEGLGVQGCEMCHGPASLHVKAEGGRDNILSPRKNPDICFSCHMDTRAQFHLPYHHQVIEGKISCSDCHSPHGMDVRPWSAVSVKDVNEACFKCHKEQRGPFVFEHEAVREGCVTCHSPHGSIQDKMLKARDSNLCLRCHTQVNFPTVGKSNHASRLPRGTCFSAGCHTGVHGSNFDEHLRY